MQWGCASQNVSKVQCFCRMLLGARGKGWILSFPKLQSSISWDWGSKDQSWGGTVLWRQECLFFSFFSEFLSERPGRSEAPLMNFKLVICEAVTFPYA